AARRGRGAGIFLLRLAGAFVIPVAGFFLLWATFDYLRNQNANRALVVIVAVVVGVGGIFLLYWAMNRAIDVLPERWAESFRPQGFGSNIGLLNGIVTAFGSHPIAWLDLQPWNNLLLMVIMVWMQTGFAMVVLSAAIKAVPDDIVEAARIDGASELQVFWRI